MTIYLYVKQHSVTGLKYFGKTTDSDPFSYKGSGKYWTNHIKKHGKEYVETIDVWEFDDQDLCTEFALTFSKNNNIVESELWANLMLENGLNGGSPKGRTFSVESKTKMSLSAKSRKPCSTETREKLSLVAKNKSAETRAKNGASHKGKTLSEETKSKMSLAAKGRTFSAETRAKIGAANKLRKFSKNVKYHYGTSPS